MSGNIQSSMENSDLKIESYLEENCVAPDLSDNRVEFLKWHTLSLLSKDIDCEITYFKNFISPWIATDDVAQTSWTATKNELASYSVDLDDLILKLCFISFDKSKSDLLFNTLENFSQKSQIPGITFQAAFMAFNKSMPERCISLLESIGKETSQTLTLKAQAHQDLKQFDKAHDALCLATEVNPNDGLAWFQLARNDLAMAEIDSAWDALLVCEKVLKEDGEVNLLKVLVGLEKFAGNEKESLVLFTEGLDYFALKGLTRPLFAQFANFCVKYGTEDWFITLCKHSDFKKFSLEDGMLNYTAKTLRQLHMLKWHDASIAFNEGIQSLISSMAEV
ncbi:hypothetical protein N9W79_01585 [bacterium]|nr:hypothetical protein [bacterium]